MRVFIAGGTGHSGSYIIPELIAAGHDGLPDPVLGCAVPMKRVGLEHNTQKFTGNPPYSIPPYSSL